MPKETHNTDYEILAHFLGKKVFRKTILMNTNHLQAVHLKEGGLALHWRISDIDTWEVWLKIKTVGNSGKRNILIIDPSYGSEQLIRRVYQSFDNMNILWSKGLAPLALDKALELNHDYFERVYAVNPRWAIKS